MVTFILTPTFSISAFLVGALPLAYSAPLPGTQRNALALVNRGCHQAGCLFVEPSRSVSSETVPTSTAAATATSVSFDASDAAEDSPNPVEAVARALRAAIPYTGEFPAITGQVADVDQILRSGDTNIVD